MSFAVGLVLGTLYVGGYMMSQNEVTAGDLMSFMVATQTIQRCDSALVTFSLVIIVTAAVILLCYKLEKCFVLITYLAIMCTNPSCLLVVLYYYWFTRQRTVCSLLMGSVLFAI